MIYAKLIEMLDQNSSLLDKYKQFFNQYKTIYFLGAGKDGILTVKLLEDILKDKELYFIDKDKSKHNQEIYNGIYCYGIEKMFGCDFRNTVIIITTFKYVDELYYEFGSAGPFKAKDKLDCTYVCDKFIRVFNTDFMEFRKCYLNYRADILSAFDMLDDAESCNILFRVLKGRIKQEECLADVFSPNQYFPELIKNRLNEDEVFLDCGSYVGDTIEIFKIETADHFKKVYAFELDKENFSRLRSNKKVNDERIVLINAGVGKENTQIKYAQLGTTSSTCKFLDNNPNVCYAEIKSVDELIKQGQIKEKVTFVKMDVEGAELDALKGMEEMLKRDMPKLAISVYHKLEDLWEIPLFLKSVIPQYEFSLRHHRDGMAETVLYAVVE